MPTVRKTLITLAISAAPLPSLAQTITLDDSGLRREHQLINDDLTISGSFTGRDRNAIHLSDSRVMGDLSLASAINDNDRTFSDSTHQTDGIHIASSSLGGQLTNTGNVKTTSLGGAALRLRASTVDGDLRNLGQLKSTTGVFAVSGVQNYGIDLASPNTGTTLVRGDVLNAEGALIEASSPEARAINVAGANLEGKVINRGLIRATSSNAIGILATSSPDSRAIGAVLAGIENHGEIFAGAEGIVLDGATLTDTLGRHIINTGRITTSGTAIRIGNVALDGPGMQPWQKANGDVNIFNSGSLWADVAIDASASSHPVELILREGSEIYGTLTGIANIEVEGDSTYGTTVINRGSADIRLVNDGWLDVGSAGDPPVTLHFDSDHTRIDGNLRVADNSALGMLLSEMTAPNEAIVKVSGITEFGQNARIALTPEGDDFQAGGTRYLLLEAGRVNVLDASGTPKVVSTSALLNVTSSTLEDNKVYATVSTKPTEALDQIVTAQGGNGNAQQALRSLSQAGLLARLSNQDPLFLAAARADEAQLARLAEQLAPEVSDGARQAALASQRLIGNAIDGRAYGLRTHTASAPSHAPRVWMQSLYSDASQQRRDGIAGYNAHSRGMAIGADGQLNDQLSLGTAYSFIDTDVNGKRGNKTQVQSHAFSLYGSYTLDNYFVDVSLTYGLNDNEGKREIAGTRAKSDYDSNLLGLNLVGGYGWQVNPRLLVEPRVAARYSRVDVDGYREKGSSAALKVEDQRYEAIELGAGIRLAGNLPLGAGTLQPQLKLMTYHDFAADPVQNTSTFVLGSNAFVTRGANVSRNSYEAGLGVDYKLGAVSVGVSYDYVGKSGFDADAFSARVRYAF
ncbi:autotransporter outer membrane beta-barrel domain-containing protein [Pseudomonas maumuensis]|uniref:Autotransporter outer membrane beta-barrel domain-containing protein n=1 Tax=Pseudomonas maumuensis TaxID=2842354 RepID=A0ABX8NST0_9PSED|nr:autotransporter outer membrane beta-barrel domain-containing protein [Pseudomonas maumuensis]